MSAHKHFDRICAAVIAFALIITVLFMNGEALGIEKIVDADAERNSDSEYFTDNDLNGDWNGYQVRTITLNGDTAKISGTGAYVEYGDVYITQSGYYEISGDLSDGSIIVAAKNHSKVWIRLNGVTVNCEDNACIIVEKADKVFLTLAEDSENILTSGSEYSEEAVGSGINAVIYAKDDLTINGSGSLTVSGGWRHGIKANDDLIITGGNITVEASGDAIHVNDSCRITEAVLNLSAGDEGIDLDGNEEETAGSESGYLYIESGNITIDAQDDGIHTAGDITVDGGGITISAADDGINANGGSGNGFGGMGGGQIPMGSGKHSGFSGTSDETSEESGAEPQELPDEEMSKMPENFDGEMPEFSEGERPETPEDYYGEMPEGTAEGFSDDEQNEETYVRFTGGTLTIINPDGQDADGIDSNGSIFIDGGSILISLAGSGSNCALDYGSENQGQLIVTGGTIIACGGSSMIEEFDESCTQAAVIYLTETTAEAGTLFSLKTADGEEILSWEPDCSYSAIAFSCPEMKTGETYTVSIGDISEEITLESTATSISSAEGMGMGGMQGPGGMNVMQGQEGTNGMQGQESNHNGMAGHGTDKKGMPDQRQEEKTDSGETDGDNG